MNSLPPYIYGREARPNERVWTEQAIRLYGEACAGREPQEPVTREFTNELGNRIKITIEGPTSASENILTPMEAAELWAALNGALPAAQQPAGWVSYFRRWLRSLPDLPRDAPYWTNGRFAADCQDAADLLGSQDAQAPAAQQPAAPAYECERCGEPPEAHTGSHHCDNQSFRAQQPAVEPVAYRILQRGEPIQASDEFLAEDAVTWVRLDAHPNTAGLFVGMGHAPGVLRPARRLLASPTAQPGEKP